METPVAAFHRVFCWKGVGYRMAGTSLDLTHAAGITGDAVEHAVDETAGVARAEAFRQLDGGDDIGAGADANDLLI